MPISAVLRVGIVIAALGCSKKSGGDRGSDEGKSTGAPGVGAGAPSEIREIPGLGSSLPASPTPASPAGSGINVVPSDAASDESMARLYAPDSSTLTQAMVVAKIETEYMTNLKRCYKRQLSTDPEVNGKVTLGLSIDAAGRSIQPDISSDHAKLTGCVKALAAAWQFPIPKDTAGNPTQARFQIALQLLPE